MAFPSVNDYVTDTFFPAATGNTTIPLLLDTGGHAKVVDIVIQVTTAQTSWHLVSLYQCDTSAGTGASAIGTQGGVPAVVLAANTHETQYIFRLKAGDGVGEWDGPIEGRYLAPIFTGVGNYNLDCWFITHNSDEYECE